MAKRPQDQRGRRYQHIDRGGDAFLPLERMRQIRWEEALIRSTERREGREVKAFTHVHFHCGSGCCLGTPIPQTEPAQVRRPRGKKRR